MEQKWIIKAWDEVVIENIETGEEMPVKQAQSIINEAMAGVDRLWTLDDVPMLKGLNYLVKVDGTTVTLEDPDVFGPLSLVQDISVERVCDPNQWGLCKFHPLSFGAGFLLSSLFWLIIGIAIGVLSR